MAKRLPSQLKKLKGTTASLVHPDRSAPTRGSRPCKGLTEGCTSEGAGVEDIHTWANRQLRETLARCVRSIAKQAELLARLPGPK